MTLQEIANFGEIFGAAGVIASLVFVRWQIKTNTKTARMRMHEQITHTFLSFLNVVVLDPDAFVAGLRSTDSNFAELSDGQKMFFFSRPCSAYSSISSWCTYNILRVSWTRRPGTPGANIFECIITSRERRRGGVSERQYSCRDFMITWSHRSQRV